MQKYSHFTQCLILLIGAKTTGSVTVTRSFKKVSVAQSRQILQGSLLTSEAACLAQMGNQTEQSLTDYHAATYDRETRKCQLIELNMTATNGTETVDLLVAGDSAGTSTIMLSLRYGAWWI